MARPAKYAEIGGHVIEGLSKDAGNGEYYLTRWKKYGLSKRLNFGRNPVIALQEFRKWQSRHNHKPVEMKAEKAILHTPFDMDFDFSAMTTATATVNEAEMIAWAKDFIQRNPGTASDVFGFRVVPENEKEGYEYTLAKIGENFFDRPKFADLDRLKIAVRNEYKEMKKTWALFCEVVARHKIGDVTKADIIKYRDHIQQLAKDKDWATTTIRKHYEHPKRIVNFAIRDFDYTQRLEQVHTWMKGLLVPPTFVPKHRPHCISPDDFHKILIASSVEERAMWLISANGAYYAQDLADLPADCVDTQTGIIAGFPRGKNRLPRAAYLWKETIQAIDAYRKENPHKGGTFFWSRKLRPFSRYTIGDKFRAVLTKLCLQNRHNHSHFRDSFETIAQLQMTKLRPGESFANIKPSIYGVLGHTPDGIEKHYLDVAVVPQMVEVASSLVRSYYFPDKPVKRKAKRK